MPIDLKMAWRNVWRNPRRSLLTIFAIAFACLVLVFMLSFQFGSYETMINTSVKIYTGHLQIQAKDYQEKRDIRLVVSDPKVIEKHLKGIPHLQGFTFRAQAFSLVSSGKRTYGTLVNGIDPKNEASVSRLKSLIVKGSYLSQIMHYRCSFLNKSASECSNRWASQEPLKLQRRHLKGEKENI